LVTLVLTTLLVSIWFFYSKGAQCCAELRLLLDSGAGVPLVDGVCGAPPPFDPAALGCPPGPGPCLDYTGDCADLQEQFIDLQGCYMYGDPGDVTAHDTLADWVCHAFPDDAYVTDQFFVGLISVAIALPVDLILAGAFETANEGDGPESWLEAPPGKWNLLLGKDAHNGWRLADPRRPVNDIALWLMRYPEEGYIGTVLRLLAWCAAQLQARLRRRSKAPDSDKEEGDEDDAGESGSGETSASAEARADALVKRLYASAGLLGVYVTWTIMSWFIFVRAREPRMRVRAALLLSVLGLAWGHHGLL
jgi:hypothetical protein